MEKLAEESQKGSYDVYLKPDGNKIYVMEGLDPADTISSSPLQQFIQDNYTYFSLFYWALLIGTLVYVAGLNIVIPILRRNNLY